MKRLMVLRHAKSDWDDAVLDDFDRPLSERGRTAAPAIAAYMAREGLKADFALVSPARRTSETWAHVAPSQAKGIKMDCPRELYLAEADTLLHRLRTLDDAHASVLLIGHNPGLEDLVIGLCARKQGEAGTAALKRIAEKFPTGALAVLVLPIGHWRDLSLGNAELAAYATPRDLT